MADSAKNPWDWAEHLETTFEETLAVAAPFEFFQQIPQDLLPVLKDQDVVGRVMLMLVQSKVELRELESLEVESQGYWPVQINQIITGCFLKCTLLGYTMEDLKALGIPPDFLVHARDLKTMGQVDQMTNRVWDFSPPKKYDDGEGNAKNLRIYQDGITQVTSRISNELLLPEIPKDALQNFVKYRRKHVLEVRDDRHVNLYRTAVVVGLFGWKLQVSVDQGNGKRSQMCVDPGWSEIHPKGYCVKSGAKMELEPSIWKVESSKSPKKKLCLDPEETTATQKKYDISIGQVFECVHPITMQLISAAEVTKVLDDGYFLYKMLDPVHPNDLIEYGNGRNEFHTHITSPTIMPCNFCTQAGHPEYLTTHDDDENEDVTFEWDQYLKETHKDTLKIPEEILEAHAALKNPWKIGMLVEATDLLTVEVVGPAIISARVSNRLFRIHFNGWSDAFDQWRPVQNPLVYPVGWCKLMGYPLSSPGGQYMISKYLPDLPDSFYEEL